MRPSFTLIQTALPGRHSTSDAPTPPILLRMLQPSELYAPFRFGPAGQGLTGSSCINVFAYPVACLVLMLIGIPLGLSSRRGGKSTGFVITIALVFIYYSLSLTGRFRLAPCKASYLFSASGSGLANILFAALGVILVRQAATGDVAVNSTGVMRACGKLRHSHRRHGPSKSPQHAVLLKSRPRPEAVNKPRRPIPERPSTAATAFR